MARILPPPAERFDPITARWVTPGGPLHAPQRDSLDPDHDEPLELVAPIPPELAGMQWTDGDLQQQAPGRWRRRRWLLLAVVGFGIAALLLTGSLIV